MDKEGVRERRGAAFIVVIADMVAKHDQTVTVRGKGVRNNVRVGVVLVDRLMRAIEQKLSNLCIRLALVESAHVDLVHIEHRERAVAHVPKLLDYQINVHNWTRLPCIRGTLGQNIFVRLLRRLHSLEVFDRIAGAFKCGEAAEARLVQRQFCIRGRKWPLWYF